jgi:hypothetical protein
MKKTLLSLSAVFALCAPHASYAGAGATHIPGIFLGATNMKSETEFTFGIEYEYKLSDKWGVGAVFERTNAAHYNDGVAVGLVSAYYHPTNSVRFGIGFGQERVGGGHPHKEDLYRLSAVYDIHFENFGLAPTLAVDFIDGQEAVVFGFAITKPF